MSTPPLAVIRVLIIDDHPVICEGLCLLLENQPGLRVVGTATTCTEALALAGREAPDIILLDLDLGHDSALTCLPQLRAMAPRARVIILTGVHDVTLHQQAVRLGAMGLVLKEQVSTTLFEAIERVYQGEAWIERTMVANVLQSILHPVTRPDPEAEKIATLTRREREVIALIGEGFKNQEIADRLSLKPVTVGHHLTSIFTKLGVSDRLALVIYAYRHGLIELRP